MNNDLFHRERWKSLSSAERLTTARQLTEHLPAGFVFRGLETHSLGTQTHSIAFFTWNENEKSPRKFALIPGGEVTLGYDRERPFVPTLAQSESWENTQEEYGSPDLARFLGETLTPLRTVSLNPFLMEKAFSDSKYSPEMLTADQVSGFRLPTADEWEWACGAGSRTLWRWGDDSPADRYPCDSHEADAAWNRPNAFGLTIAFDDYQQELCAGGLFRGGDGGCFTCGGAGFLAAWLTLSSAYVPTEGWEEYCHRRRVFPL